MVTHQSKIPVNEVKRVKSKLKILKDSKVSLRSPSPTKRPMTSRRSNFKGEIRRTATIKYAQS